MVSRLDGVSLKSNSLRSTKVSRTVLHLKNIVPISDSGLIDFYDF